ncbi:MAG: hypothetical protein N0A15_02760 [Anaerolineae bacterium]|nr:hypothetical protein [Anaerolineae bacterium]
MVAGLKAIPGVRSLHIERAQVVIVHYDPQQTDVNRLLDTLNSILLEEASR